MDIKIAKSALQRAESLHVGSGKPDSARVKGGWQFGVGLDPAIRGIKAGENWKLVVVLKRSGHRSDAGPQAFFTWSEETRESIDEFYGREEAATTIFIDLNKLFKNLIYDEDLI